MAVLRENESTLTSVLATFLDDPLMEWERSQNQGKPLDIKVCILFRTWLVTVS